MQMRGEAEEKEKKKTGAGGVGNIGNRTTFQKKRKEGKIIDLSLCSMSTSLASHAFFATMAASNPTGN